MPETVSYLEEVLLLTVFGSLAVGAMFIFYWLEHRSPWFVLLFALACAMSSAYGFLINSYPFGVIEGLWALVALRRFSTARRGHHEAQR